MTETLAALPEEPGLILRTHPMDHMHDAQTCLQTNTHAHEVKVKETLKSFQIQCLLQDFMSGQSLYEAVL